MAWETKLHSKHWIAHHAKVMFSLDFTSIYELQPDQTAIMHQLKKLLLLISQLTTSPV